MKAENVIKLNQIIGKAMVEAAYEAYLARVEVIKSKPFDDVVEAVRTFRNTGYKKADGYNAKDAFLYLDRRLEEEDYETWLETEDDFDDLWYVAVEQFRW